MKKKGLLAFAALALMLASCNTNNEQPAAEADTTLSDSVHDKAWQEITPRDIEGNPYRMFADEWFELAAGKEGDMNLMTIAWGTMGELWARPVVIVYVSTSRYTYEFMEKNDYFTLTHFPPSMREQLQYLGTASGRDEDKVKGAGLTTEFTALGNPIFAEADLAIECKKIYAEQFKAELMPVERRQWHQETGTGIHVMYVGEIVNVWKK